MPKTMQFGDECVFYAEADYSDSGQAHQAKVQKVTTDKYGRQTLSLLVFPAMGGPTALKQNVQYIHSPVLQSNPNQKKYGAWDTLEAHRDRETARLEKVRQQNQSQATMPPPEMLPPVNTPFSPQETTEEKITRNYLAGQPAELICQVIGADEAGWPLSRVKEYIASLEAAKAEKANKPARKGKKEKEPALA